MISTDRPYRLAVFDIDGTLIDTEKTGVLSLIKTIRELMGVEMPYEDAYKYFGIPSRKVSGLLGYSGTEDFGTRWEENFIGLSHYISPFPGVREMLSRIKECGVMTGLVTSRSRFEFEYDKYLVQLLDLIDVSICADDIVRHKPHPDPLLECVSRASEMSADIFGVSSCIYLGDTAHDWKCASDAGCDFALADWKCKGMQGIDADYHFTNSDEALEILGCSDF